MSRGIRLLAGLLATLVATAAAWADGERFTDERTGLPGWQLAEQGIRLKLIQRLPDQTRAFFLARGFDRASVEHLVDACVMQTILRNTDDERPLRYHLSEWWAETDQGKHHLVLKKEWQRRWQQRNQSQSARIAFQWSLLPTRQHFQPGDWNMGMTTYPFAPGTVFDLHMVWHRGERTFSATVKDVECAPDVDASELDLDRSSQ